MTYPTNPDTDLPDIPGHYFRVSRNEMAAFYNESVFKIELVEGKPRPWYLKWLSVKAIDHTSVVTKAEATDWDKTIRADQVELTADDVKRAAAVLADRYETRASVRENNDKYLGDYPPRSAK